MANISQFIQKIRSAIYGEEVRGSIADALTAMNTETESYVEQAAAQVELATQQAENSSTSATASAGSATSSANSAITSKSWAVGGTGTREGEDTNNAKYYSEVAAQSVADYTEVLEKLGDEDISEVGTSVTNAINNLAEGGGGVPDDVVLKGGEFEQTEGIPRDADLLESHPASYFGTKGEINQLNQSLAFEQKALEINDSSVINSLWAHEIVKNKNIAFVHFSFSVEGSHSGWIYPFRLPDNISAMIPHEFDLVTRNDVKINVLINKNSNLVQIANTTDTGIPHGTIIATTFVVVLN